MARLAADLCGTEIALITLVDSDRQWFKARVGVEQTDTARDLSFCGHCINHSTPARRRGHAPRRAPSPTTPSSPGTPTSVSTPASRSFSTRARRSGRSRWPTAIRARRRRGRSRSLERLARQIAPASCAFAKIWVASTPSRRRPTSGSPWPGAVVGGRLARGARGRTRRGGCCLRGARRSRRARGDQGPPPQVARQRHRGRALRAGGARPHAPQEPTRRPASRRRQPRTRRTAPCLTSLSSTSRAPTSIACSSRGGRVPYREAFSGWCADACDGVAEAHELGVVHRDIKPSNVFLAAIAAQARPLS